MITTITTMIIIIMIIISIAVGVEQDMKAAVKYYRMAAEQGHATAQKCLGRHLSFHLNITICI